MFTGQALPVGQARRSPTTFGATQARVSSREPGTIQGEPEAPSPVQPLEPLTWPWGRHAWDRPRLGQSTRGLPAATVSEAGKRGCQLTAAPTMLLQG